MHEYSVASELINALLPQVGALDGRVVGVILKKGELRILSDQALGNAFEVLAQGTLLQSARLMVELVPVTVSCSACGYMGSVEHVCDEAFHFSVPILTCPQCGSEVDVRTGRELFVDRLTVQTPGEAESR
jgi:hydrogenase nickel incorporation protein HypA/HybF